MFRCFPHIMLAWEDRCHHHNVPPILSLSLILYWCTWCYILWGIHLVSLGQLSQHCPLPTSCPSQPSGLLGVRELERKPWYCEVLFSSSQNTGVLTTLFNTDAEPCTPQATMRSINSIPTSPDQHWNCTANTGDSAGTLEPLLSYLLNLLISFLCRFSLPPCGQVEAVKSISWPLAGLHFWAGRSGGIWRGIADIQSLRSS